MDIPCTIGALIGGFAGGNLAGSFIKVLTLGTIGDSLTGLAGGVIGSCLLHRQLGITLSSASPVDVPMIISHVAAGAVAGAGVMVGVALLARGLRRA